MMKTIIIKGLFLILGLSAAYIQIFSQTNDINLKRGLEIVEQSRKIINEKNPSHKVMAVQLSQREAIAGININQEFFLEFPDKLKNIRASSERSKSFNTWNGEKFLSDYELYSDGRTYRLNEMRARLSPEKRAQVDEMSKSQKPAFLTASNGLPDDPKSNFLEAIWLNVFPLTLESSFEPAAQFEYIGKAESSDQRADIVDVKSQYFRKIRLFFDEKTHLLLLMETSLEGSEGYSKEKYYFSNHKIINGLLVPTTIKVQNEFISKDGKTIKQYDASFIYLDDLKINLTFSKDTFKVE